MNLELSKDIVIIVAGTIGLFTFIMNFIENRKQGRQKRVELYMDMTKRLQDDADFRKIRQLLKTKDQQGLKEISWGVRSDYAGFFEDVALLTYSGLIRKEIACYMFSDDAIACWDSEDFWQDFKAPRKDEYWGILRLFVEEMRDLHQRLFVSRQGEVGLKLNIPRRKMSF
jgi:hypothetical protein